MLMNKNLHQIVSAFMMLAALCVGSAQAALAPVAADVLVVIDELRSMRGEQRWVADVIPTLEQDLREYGIGSESQSNQYGLIGFAYRGVAHRRLMLDGELLGSADAFVGSANLLRTSGGTEDGWRGISYALDSYPRRNGAAVNIVLVTDEDRDNTISTITYETVLEQLNANNTLLNAVVNAQFQCGDGASALGMDSLGIGYVADGLGGFTTCTGASAISGYGTTIANYVNLAVKNGGAAWDLNFLRRGGHYATSFTNALLNIKVDEILNQRPTGDLVAVASAVPNPAVAGQEIVLDGSQSFHQLDGHAIVSWDWDLDNDLSYVDAIGDVVDVTNQIGALGVGDHIIRLRVTDNTSNAFPSSSMAERMKTSTWYT
jgi:hypothetical protein